MMNRQTKINQEYQKLLKTDRLMLDGSEFQIVRIGSHDHLVRGQKYARLADEPMGDPRFKIIIEVHRYYDRQKPELIGALKAGNSDTEYPVFVSIYDPNYRKNRAVFYGDSGLAIVNQTLRNIGRYCLATGINRMVYQELMIVENMDSNHPPLSQRWE